MSGFKFPRPPPPPPRAAADWSRGSDAPRGDRGGCGRGRGRGGNERGARGRGGNEWGGRGRGNSGDQRQNYGNSQPMSFSVISQNGANYGQPNTTPAWTQPLQPYQAPPPALPPGSYVNPRFATQPQQPLGGYGKPGLPGLNGQAQAPQSGYPPRTFAGHKRKLDAIRGSQPETQDPVPKAALAIPNFGGPVIPPHSSRGPLPKVQGKTKSASNALGLTPSSDLADEVFPDDDDAAGPDADVDADADADVDEEALYAELGEKLTFEHNGTVMSLNSAAELAAWQHERRRNWPTRNRMAEKDAERRRTGEERRRLLAGAAVLRRPVSAVTKRPVKQSANPTPESTSLDGVSNGHGSEGPTTKISVPESELEKARRELAEQTARLDKLRKSVTAGQAAAERAKARQQVTNEAGDGTLDQSSPGALQGAMQRSNDTILTSEVSAEREAGGKHYDDSDASSVLSDSSVVSEGSPPGSESDDEGPPEQTTSKPPAPDPRGAPKLLCKYHVASGHCRDGDTCRYRHELPARGSGVAATSRPFEPRPPKPEAPPQLENVLASDKKSIYERLLQQQQNEEDHLALQVIKYLGKAGLFGVEQVTSDHATLVNRGGRVDGFAMRSFLFFATTLVVANALDGPQWAMEDGNAAGSESSLIHKLEKAEIIPTVIDSFTPQLTLSIFWEHATAEVGNRLSPSQLQTAPDVQFIDSVPGAPSLFNKDMQLTLAMTDPDAPSRDDPLWSEFCHWIATGVQLTDPNDDVGGNGFSRDVKDIVSYKPPDPPPRTGKHRYVFVALVPRNGTTAELRLSQPKDRRHWGYKGSGRRGLKEWALENELVVVGANFIYAANTKQ